MLSKIAFFACLPLLATVCASPVIAGESELDKLFAAHPGKSAANICMVRHYDKAHLAAHPEQNVTDMLLYIGKREGEQDGWVYYSANAQVKFRDSKQIWGFAGDCGHEIGSDKKSIGCGIDCDGGGYDITVVDKKSVTLTITSGVRLGEPDSDETVATAGFKDDDKTFRLEQTELSDCLPVIYDEDLKAQISKGAVTQ